MFCRVAVPRSASQRLYLCMYEYVSTASFACTGSTDLKTPLSSVGGKPKAVALLSYLAILA